MRSPRLSIAIRLCTTICTRRRNGLRISQCHSIGRTILYYVVTRAPSDRLYVYINVHCVCVYMHIIEQYPEERACDVIVYVLCALILL